MRLLCKAIEGYQRLEVEDVNAGSCGIDYVAISHVWTRDDRNRPQGEWARWRNQVLGGGEYNKALRQAMTICQVRYLWIDTLCIYQEYDYDKNVAIPNMREIYSNAKAVVIMLPEEDGEIPTQRCIKQLIGVLENHSVSASYDNENTEAIAIGLKYHDWPKVFLFCVRVSLSDWAARVWTLQESILSKKTVIAASDCTEYVEKWGANWACSMILRHWNIAASMGHDVINDTVFFSIEKLNNVLTRSLGTPMAIAELMYLSQGRSCTRAEDRVYGILGLLPKVSISIEYGISMRQLSRKLQDVALACNDHSIINFLGDGVCDSPVPYLASCKWPSIWPIPANLVQAATGLKIGTVYIGKIVYTYGSNTGNFCIFKEHESWNALLEYRTVHQFIETGIRLNMAHKDVAAGLGCPEGYKGAWMACWMCRVHSGELAGGFDLFNRTHKLSKIMLAAYGKEHDIAVIEVPNNRRVVTFVERSARVGDMLFSTGRVQYNKLCHTCIVVRGSTVICRVGHGGVVMMSWDTSATDIIIQACVPQDKGLQ